MRTISMRRWSDYHCHFRNGTMMEDVLPHSARICGKVMAMPNTDPPLLTADESITYGLIANNLLKDYLVECKVYTTIKFTPKTTPKIISNAKGYQNILAFKLYPDGVTMNSHGGFTRQMLLNQSQNFINCFEMMQSTDSVLSVHGVLPGSFTMDAEHEFLVLVLAPIMQMFPKLRVVLEHISSEDGITFVQEQARRGHRIAGTIAMPHTYLTLDEVKGHNYLYCEPHPKRPEDRTAIRNAMFSGESLFFFGSDSAPHTVGKKHCLEACPGVYSAPVFPKLIEDFEAASALHNMERFTSTNGDNFYDLPHCESKIVFVNKPWEVPLQYEQGVIPIHQGETVRWQAPAVIK